MSRFHLSIALLVVLLNAIILFSISFLPSFETSPSQDGTLSSARKDVDLLSNGDKKRKHVEISSSESAEGCLSTNNSFQRVENRSFEFCIGNCNPMGLGANLIRKAMLHNMSMVLGFKLHFQDSFVDHSRDYIQGDFLRPILPHASYYPERCDFFWGSKGPGAFKCFRELILRFENLFDLYHVQMYMMLAEYYSMRLRALATDAFGKITTMFKQPTYIGTHVMHEYQYADHKQDARKRRNLTIDEYREMMNHLEMNHVPLSTKPVYLVIGDSSVQEFKAERMLLVENWLEEEYPHLTRLQIIMVAIDILSRTRIRLISKFGSNFIVHMGFHRLNSNIFELVVGDVFSMRTYDYFGNELALVSSGLDLTKYLTRNNNPYTVSRNPASHEYTVACFRRNVFSSRDIKQKFSFSYSNCSKDFSVKELGQARPKEYPTRRDLLIKTSYF